MRIQSLAGYAAMANGQKSDIQMSEDVLGSSSEVVAKYVKIPFCEFPSRPTPVQHPQCGQLLKEDVLWQIAQSLELLGNKWNGNSLRIGSRAINPDGWVPKGCFAGDDGSEVFVYPFDMSEREIAANILTSFLNNSHPADMRYGDVLSFDGSMFKAKEAFSSEATLDNEIARLAVESLVLLCPYCRHPVLREQGRKHCSDSCKTKICNQKRDKRKGEVYRMSLAGDSVGDIIDAVGVKYEKTIIRWHEEARALGSSTVTRAFKERDRSLGNESK
jgi:transposase-like protein